MSNFSTQIILEKRRPRKKDGKFPVRLRVTINRKSLYYGLGSYLSEEDFDKMYVSRPRQKYKKMLAEFMEEEKRANDLLEAMESPSFDQFKRLFLQKGEGGGNVEKYYLAYIKECKDDDRHGTASSYECSLKSLKEIKGLDGVNFRNITPRWLMDYERKMLDKRKSISTVGVYLRPLSPHCSYPPATCWLTDFSFLKCSLGCHTDFLLGRTVSRYPKARFICLTFSPGSLH